ncbi:MAG TPA: helix-turn-helix domain-containing protein [Pirellulales bacterium]|jgi:excisionase family DNA binding protein|nr:helix-turn-helix domain-containing protein [Pirellulales bacterium]
MSDFLTAEEIAERLRVTPGTVMIWARENRIPSIRISRRVVRFDPVAVEKAITDLHVAAPQDVAAAA